MSTRHNGYYSQTQQMLREADERWHNAQAAAHGFAREEFPVGAEVRRARGQKASGEKLWSKGTVKSHSAWLGAITCVCTMASTGKDHDVSYMAMERVSAGGPSTTKHLLDQAADQWYHAKRRAYEHAKAEFPVGTKAWWAHTRARDGSWVYRQGIVKSHAHRSVIVRMTSGKDHTIDCDQLELQPPDTEAGAVPASPEAALTNDAHRANDAAVQKLSEATAALVQSGQYRHAQFVKIRMPWGDGFTDVHAMVFTDSKEIADVMVARLGEPTLAERTGLVPIPGGDQACRSWAPQESST